MGVIMGPGNREPGDVLDVGALIRRELAAHGIESHLEQADDLETAKVIEASGKEWFLWNLVHRLRGQEDRDAWPDTVHRHVDSMLESRIQPQAEQMSPEELRGCLRSRLVADVDDGTPTDLSYGRPFAPGIIEVLCADYPHSVTTLGRGHVEELPLGIDEAFDIGRANTVAEPVDESFEAADGVRILTGDSLFVASKAIDIAALVGGPIGPAPHGLAFALPNRSLLLYQVLSAEDWIQQTAELVQLVESMVADPEYFHPGGVVSDAAYYWAPDGRIDLLGGRHIDEDGETSLWISPPDSLADYLPVEPQE
ncbi:Nicotinic acid phosphoribosyltransferase [Acidipropionibacterium acidipropionici ATCC 4875]|uniref:Nicotinic acid phosphoribosyltransferase n=2 Tax=Acidipropionibacterium acidipropionici TaxID=1748 RepID=K7RNF7_ACIA4|nr:Nicotinic acid phosphoribosyltransferase [Acidipropionibacterium acidipropionici ATCC 4875]